MLPRAGLSNEARFLHAPGEQRLPDRIVDLMGAGMAQVLALEVNLRTTQSFRQTLGEIQRRRPPDIFFQIVLQLGLKPLIPACALVYLFQFQQGRHESFRDIPSAVRAEPPMSIWYRHVNSFS